MRFLFSLLDRYLTHRIVQKLYQKRHIFQWSEIDQKHLGSFVSNPTGGKLLAHLQNVLQGLLQEAMTETDPRSAAHKLATARGFALALAAIRVSQPEELPEPELNEDEEAAFWNPVKTRPALFK